MKDHNTQTLKSELSDHKLYSKFNNFHKALVKIKIKYPIGFLKRSFSFLRIRRSCDKCLRFYFFRKIKLYRIFFRFRFSSKIFSKKKYK